MPTGNLNIVSRMNAKRRMPRIGKHCDCHSVSVGRLQRDNPIPPGTYWLDVIDESNQADFAAWRLEHADKVRILKSEHFDAIRWPDCPITEGECSPSRDWVKFEISSPVVWEAQKFGFPNIIAADEKIESSADTATVPDFSDNCDIGCQAQKVAIAAGVVFGGVALIMILKGIK